MAEETQHDAVIGNCRGRPVVGQVMRTPATTAGRDLGATCVRDLRLRTPITVGPDTGRRPAATVALVA
jgi:hypothetical protein